jgi:hypothetical protein
MFRRLSVCVTLGHFECIDASRVGHQVPNSANTSHREQPSFSINAITSPQAPQSIVKPVAVKDGQHRQLLIISLSLA